MAKYRKLIAVLIGVGLIITLRHYDIEIMGLDGLVLDIVMGAATAFGVYQAPNELE